MVATTTPRTVTRPIRELCARLNAKSMPQFVRVEPRTDSLPGDCFNDVKRHISEHGGALVHGWLLWEWPGILVEAEFHAVWRNSAGELIDIATKGEGEKSVLFVVDEQKIWEGEGARVDNVRHAVGNDPRIRTFIQNQNRFFKLFRARFGNVVGEVELDDELADIVFRQKQLGQELATSPVAQRAWASFVSVSTQPRVPKGT